MLVCKTTFTFSPTVNYHYDEYKTSKKSSVKFRITHHGSKTIRTYLISNVANMFEPVRAVGWESINVFSSCPWINRESQCIFFYRPSRLGFYVGRLVTRSRGRGRFTCMNRLYTLSIELQSIIFSAKDLVFFSRIGAIKYCWLVLRYELFRTPNLLTLRHWRFNCELCFTWIKNN